MANSTTQQERRRKLVRNRDYLRALQVMGTQLRNSEHEELEAIEAEIAEIDARQAQAQPR